eukprot:tig00021569_g22353.t1
MALPRTNARGAGARANSRAPRRTPPGPGGARHPRHPSAIATAASSTAISTRTVNMRTLSRETTIRRPAAGAAAGAKTVAIAKRGANEAAGKLRVTETKAKAQLATADWPAEARSEPWRRHATTRATGDTGTGAPGTATMPTTTSTSTLMTPTTRTREMTTETMTLTVELERGGYTATMNTAAWASMARAKITTQGTPRVTPTWGMHENATAEISKRRMLTVALEVGGYSMEMASMAEHRAPMTMLGVARVVHVNAPASTAAATGTADGMDTAARPAAPAIGTTSALRATVVNATGTTGLAGQADGTAETGPAVLDAVSTGTGRTAATTMGKPRPEATATYAPQDTRDEILASARSTCRREGLQIERWSMRSGRIAAAHQADRARIRDHRIGGVPDPSALRNPSRRCQNPAPPTSAVTLRCGHVVCGDRIEESSPCIAIKYANITEARRAAQLLTPVTPQLATLAVLGATGPLSVGIHVDAPASSTEFFAIEAELVLRALTSGINPDAYEANDVVVAYNELAVKCPNGPTARY